MKRMTISVVMVLSVCRSVLAQPDTLWTRTLGTPANADFGKHVVETEDFGYVLTGTTYSFGAIIGDAFLAKYSAAGDLLWCRTYGGAGGEGGTCVNNTIDGGFIITGVAGSYIFLLKTDNMGNREWYRCYIRYANSGGYSVKQTTDGGYIIGGYYTPIIGGYNVLLLKTDAMGNQQWFSGFGGNEDDWGQSVRQTIDGGYVVAGRTESFGAGNYDAYLIKTNTNGHLQWSNTFGGTWWDDAYSVQQTDDMGYILLGSTLPSSSPGEDCDFYLIKTNTFGIQQWTRSLGGNNDNCGYDVKQTSDLGYILVGASYFPYLNSDIHIIKTNNLGIQQWECHYGGSGEDAGYCVQQTSDLGYIIAGKDQNAGGYDAYLIRLESENPQLSLTPPAADMGAYYYSHTVSVTTPPFNLEPLTFDLLPPSPNPFNSSTAITFTLNQVAEIKLSVYDVLGREIAALGTGHWASGKHQVVWEADGVGSGVYFVRLIVDGRWSMVEKVALMK